MGVKLRKRSLSKGRYSYYLDIFYDNKREYETLNLIGGKGYSPQHNKAVRMNAEEIRSEKERDLMLGNTDLKQLVNGDKDFLEYFEKQSRQRGSTMYHSAYRKLIKCFGESVKFKNINSQWIKEFRSYLIETVSNNTAHGYLNALKTVITSASKENLLSIQVLRDFENIPKTEVTKDYLTLEEIQLLSNTEFQNEYKGIDYTEIKRAFLFACFTGLRYSDIENLSWDCIKGDILEIKVVKTKRMLTLPLNETARSLLFRDRVLEMGKVFKLPKYLACLNYIKDLSKQAGVTKKVTFHTARHTFGTLSVRAGISSEVLKELMGHRDLTTTQIYYQIAGDTKKDAIAKLPNISV